MSTATDPVAPLDVDLDAPVASARKGRFDTGAEIDLGDRTAIAFGTSKADGAPHAVYMVGQTSVGIPTRAVSVFVASGRCISPASVVRAFAKAGTLKDLEAAIAAAKKPTA